jgi:hypothetical protein
MNIEIAEKWIEKLESGEYTQTKGFLRDDNGFCCLGVLSDMYIKETGKGCWQERLDGDGDNTEKFEFLGSDKECSLGPLHAEVKTWAGMDSHTGIFQPWKMPDEQREKLEELLKQVGAYKVGFRNALTDVNDEGVDFKRIAEIIRLLKEEL